MADSFVHLRVHTEYSVSEGAARVDAVVMRAADLEMPALGLADIGNMFGAVKFFEACRKRGIKPIIGCDAAVGGADTRMLLLCADNEGCGNLNRLLTRAYSENGGVIESDWLRQNNRGIIGLSGRQYWRDWAGAICWRYGNRHKFGGVVERCFWAIGFT